MNEEQIKALLEGDLNNIDAYYAQLNAIAQGNRDFVAKWLKKEFETALGTNDQARADFLAKVASKEETEMGRIPYDYEKYSKRALEDYRQGIEGIDRVKRRLQQDYDTVRAGKQIEWNDSRQNQNEQLISQRMLVGTRENAGGIAGQRIQKLEDAVDLEEKQLNADLQRSLEDQDIATKKLTLEKDRNLQDLTDNARRSAVDEMLTNEKGSEQANLNLANTVAQNNMSKDSEKGNIANQYDNL